MTTRDEIIQNFEKILEAIETNEGKVGFTKKAIQATINGAGDRLLEHYE